jgi:endoglucanase
VNAGITVGMMFIAWEHFNDKLKNLSLNIPETAPDILNI